MSYNSIWITKNRTRIFTGIADFKRILIPTSRDDFRTYTVSSFMLAWMKSVLYPLKLLSVIIRLILCNPRSILFEKYDTIYVTLLTLWNEHVRWKQTRMNISHASSIRKLKKQIIFGWNQLKWTQAGFCFFCF